MRVRLRIFMRSVGPRPQQVWVPLFAHLHKIIIKLYHEKLKQQPMGSRTAERRPRGVERPGECEGTGKQGLIGLMIKCIESNKFLMDRDLNDDSAGEF